MSSSSIISMMSKVHLPGEILIWNLRSAFVNVVLICQLHNPTRECNKVLTTLIIELSAFTVVLM